MSSADCVALFPGSFDPLTLGHEDVVRRSLVFADKVVVAVAHQPSESKKHLFTVEERLELIREVFEGESRVAIASYEGLSVDFARSVGAGVVVRGIRTAGDFEYEARMARMNRQLATEIDTVYLAAEPRHGGIERGRLAPSPVERPHGDAGGLVPAGAFDGPVGRSVRGHHDLEPVPRIVEREQVLGPVVDEEDPGAFGHDHHARNRVRRSSRSTGLVT